MDIKQFNRITQKFYNKKNIEIRDFGKAISVFKFYENNKNDIEKITTEQKNYLIHFLSIFSKSQANLFISDFFNIIDSKEDFLKGNWIYKDKNEEKLAVLEDQLKTFEEPDMYFLQVIHDLEDDFMHNPKMFNIFLDKMPYYFEKYEDNFSLLLKHLLKKEISAKVDVKLFQLINSDRNFAIKYGEKSLEIIKSIICDKDSISKFESLLCIKGLA